MRKFVMAAVATAAYGTASLMTGAPAQANPLSEALAKAQQAQATAEYTQYRGYYEGPRRVYRGDRYYGGPRYYGRGTYGRPGYYGRPYGYYRRDRGSAAAAGAAGLAAGALIGGAIASQQAQAAQNQQSAVAYCMRRFKSYDPRSGTYLGYDGKRHPCP